MRFLQSVNGLWIISVVFLGGSFFLLALVNSEYLESYLFIKTYLLGISPLTLVGITAFFGWKYRTYPKMREPLGRLVYFSTLTYLLFLNVSFLFVIFSSYGINRCLGKIRPPLIFGLCLLSLIYFLQLWSQVKGGLKPPSDLLMGGNDKLAELAKWYLTKGQVEKSLNVVINSSFQDQKRKAILLMSQYSSLEEKVAKNLVSSSEENVERAKIIFRINQILEELITLNEA